MNNRFWQTNDKRPRPQNMAPEDAGRSGTRFGRKPDHPARPASTPANRPHQGDTRRERAANPGGDRSVATRRFEDAHEQIQAAEHLVSITRRVDELARELDRRGNRAANAEIATLKQCLTELSREVGRRAERKLSDTEGPRRSDIPPARRAAGVNKEASRPAAPPFVRGGLDEILPVRNPEGRGMRVEPARGFADDYSRRQHGFEHGWQAPGTTGHSDSTPSRFDGLERDTGTREGGAADTEIAAIKHSLAELTHEIGRQMEHRLHDADGDFHRQDIHPEGRAASEFSREDAPFGAELERQGARSARAAQPAGDRSRDRRHPENHRNAIRADQSPDWTTNHLDDDSRELDRHECRDIDAKAADHDLCRHHMPATNLADAAGDAGGRAKHFGRRERQVRDDAYEARLASLTTRPDRRESAVSGAPQREQVSTAAHDRWIAGADQEHAQAETSAEPPRSRARPLAIACLAGLLAVAVGAAGAYFVHSRVGEPYAGAPTLRLFQDNAPVAEAAASRPTGILPRFSLARLQDLRFPLPELYGVYAINRGKLFELEALPGQVPDHRIAMSAAIARPSRTTVSDGHVAFVVFRRDVAENISERVPIRVVAKVKRAVVDPTAAGDAWTIRNVALDFRVAPVDQNKDMVLLRPESPDFTLPAGRYALVIKGQAYDFTIDGPITDPAQCLERVEGANGSFFHECVPEVMATAPLPQEAPPSPAPPSKSRRQAEARAQLAEQPAKPR